MAKIFDINRPNNKITLGTVDTTINIASHTASLLLSLDASKDLKSVTDLTAWVLGTANQITSTQVGGTAVLSIPNPFAVPGKLTAGSFGSPLDVTNTREYGVELHYSGNNYNATTIRARAHAVTSDTAAQFQGGLFQAANNNGIDVGVLNGVVSEAIGKSGSTSATIGTMRGGLSAAEWGAKDTVTNLFGHHIRVHSLNAAGEGSFGTGYGLCIENEAVGGNGQALDAGIYFKGTNLSAGNKAFTYGLDFSGATYDTTEIKLNDGGTIGSSGASVNITSTGKVGIGTATPTYDIELLTNTHARIAIESTGTATASELYFLQDGVFRAGVGTFGSTYGGTASNGFIMLSGINNDGWIGFITKTGGTTYDRLHIVNNGNVGINTVTPDTKLQVVGDCKLGDDNTNYTALASDGLQTMVGTARVKKEFTIDAINLDKGNQGPDAVILGNSIGYSYDIGDDSVMNFEIPYDCDTSEDIKIEIYWYINEARTGANEEVQWRAQWSACPANATEAIDAPTHTGTIDFGDQLIPTVAKYLTEVSGTIAAASIADADFVSMTIDRVVLDGGANPTADPVIVQIEVEYTMNKLGKAT